MLPAIELSSGESTYQSQVVVWEVASKVMGFHPAFQELSTRRNEVLSGHPSLVIIVGTMRLNEDVRTKLLTRALRCILTIDVCYAWRATVQG
jgi:hypothetical protein